MKRSRPLKGEQKEIHMLDTEVDVKMISLFSIDLHITVVSKLHAAALLKKREKTIGFYSTKPSRQRRGAMRNLAYWAENSGIKKYRSLFEIPSGPGKIFQNSCLVTAFTVAMMLRKAAQDPKSSKSQATVRKLNQLHSKTKSRQIKAAAFIVEETVRFLKGTNIPFQGPHSLSDLETLCQTHGAACLVFSRKVGNQLLFRYPWEFDPRLVLLIFYNVPGFRGTLTHFHVVKSLDFFKGEHS